MTARGFQEGDLLWRPTAEAIEATNLRRYWRWVEQRVGRHFDDYQALWRWSVEAPEAFWASIWDYFAVESSPPRGATLGRSTMPGAEWFPGTRVNLTREVLRRAKPDGPVVHHCSENRPAGAMTRDHLIEAVTRVAEGLRALGVGPGDRVVGYLPNLPETVVTLLATAGIGAVWSGCSPDFGRQTVVDRFSQLEPTVMIAVDGYRYGGKDFDRRGDVTAIAGAIPSLRAVVVLPNVFPEADRPPGTLSFREAFPPTTEPLRLADTEFDHPLWVVFSSGTTGLPKGIVHGHGGVLLEQLKNLVLQANLGTDDCFFFYTTSGWINFNILATSLLAGNSVVLCDGHPAHPEIDRLWQIVEDYGVTVLGASPAYVQLMRKMGIEPKARFALRRLRRVACTGAPVMPEHFEWFYRMVKSDLEVASVSGGTEVATAFFVGAPTEPVYAGEMQARGLGVAVAAFDADGRSVEEQVGELVVTKPMPSMPLRFWNDPDGRRYRETYFDLYPGVWRHGDLLKVTARGTGVIYGRSDSTLNRYGVRIGTGEIYRIVESVEAVQDSMVIDVTGQDGAGELILFVVLAEGFLLDRPLRDTIASKLKTEGSPRHVFDRIEATPAIPYTLTGKKMEVPVKRLFGGTPVERAASADAMANPESLAWYLEAAKRWRAENSQGGAR